ncbi:MAG: OmpA family protein [Bacteroidales bacterium]|nr:OmpA family protein [Bacteroidales bacterium]MBN2818021.1 OmpA family protein [Bacteroidales bacterium]
MSIQGIKFIGLIATVLATACAAPKIYDEAVKEKDDCYREREEMLQENEQLNVENTELKSKVEGSEKEIERIKNQQLEDVEELNRMKSEYQSLDKRYKELQQTHQALVSGSDSEARKMMNQLERTQKDLYTKEDQLNMLSQKLDAERRELERLSSELDDRNKRLSDLERMLAQKDEAVNALRKKVSDALMGFEGQGLTITKKNGKVYVSLDEKLLFGSGSTEVDARGVSALKKLAVVLEQNPDINITIEGHTDDVPVIPGSAMKDNWDLSVKRATAIIRILLDNSSINPKRLTASGRGEFLPVDPAKTAEARQKNRRTEIILTPNLDEIFEILEGN